MAICPGQSIPAGALSSCQGPSVVNQIHCYDASFRFSTPFSVTPVVEADGTTANLLIRPLQLVQDFGLAAVAEGELEASDVAPTPPCSSLPFSAVFTVWMSVSSLQATLHITFSAIELLGETLPQNVQDLLLPQIESSIPDLSVTLDLSPLHGLVGSVQVRNAGIATSDDFGTLAVRLDIEDVDDNASSNWGTFFAGGFSVFRGANDTFALLLDKHFVTRRLADDVTSAIIDHNYGHWYTFDVYAGPSITWQPYSTSGKFHLSVSGEQRAACYFFSIAQDIAATATADIAMSVPSANEIALKIKQEITVEDQGQLLLCGWTSAGFAWLLYGSTLLSQSDLSDDLKRAIVFGGMSALVADLVGVVVGADIIAQGLLPDVNVPGTACTTDDSVQTTTCVYDIQFSALPLLGKPTITGLKGISDGPVLLGTFHPPAHELTEPTLEVDKGGFDFGFGDPCSDATLNYTAWISLLAVGGTGFFPFELCSYTVLDDHPPNAAAPAQYTQYVSTVVLSSANIEIDIVVPINNLSNAFKNDPWPLRIRLVTNLGIREVTIAPIVAVSQAEIEAMNLQLFAARLADCMQFIPQWHEKLMVQKWLPDPPPDFVVSELHLWQMVVSGLAEGEAFGVRAAQSQQLATAYSSNGVAQWSAVLEPHSDSSVSIEPRSTIQDVETRKAELPDSPRLDLRQTPLFRVSSIHLREDCETLCLAGNARVPAIVTATASEIRSYRLENEAFPTLEWTQPFSGVKGILPNSEGWIVWGANGAGQVTRNSLGRPDRFRLVHDKSISACEGRSRIIAALQGEGLVVYSRELEVLAEVAIAQASGLAILDRLILVLTPKGIARFEWSEAGRLIALGIDATLLGKSLEPTHLPLSNAAAWLTLPEGGGVVLVADGRQGLMRAGSAPQPPWSNAGCFSGTGGRFIRLGENRRLIEVYRASRPLLLHRLGKTRENLRQFGPRTVLQN